MGGNLTFNDNDDVQLKGATDATLIGNIGDRLKTTDTGSNTKLLLQLLENANFLKLGNYTSVVPTVAGDTTYYDYYEVDGRIARASLRYVDDSDWDLTLDTFINDTDGDELLDDDSSFLNLD